MYCFGKIISLLNHKQNQYHKADELLRFH